MNCPELSRLIAEGQEISSSFYRSRRIARPLRPRSGIELRACDARGFQCEEVMARRDAGSAVADNAIAGDWRADRFAELRAQLLGSAERAGLVEIPSEEVVRRAR